MNKRQRKKNRKKQESFIASFCSSYKELREFERSYHEYILQDNRRTKFTDDTDDELIF